MNPIIEVTLEKGKRRRLTKKFKYENNAPDSETKFHVQPLTASIDWNNGV